MALRETVAHAFDTAITRCVRTSCRYPRAVITLFVALAIGAGSLATTSLGINTDTGDMISGDLPFRQNFAELKTSFPELDNNIIAVVEGDDPDVTRDGAAYLADALRQRPELFTNVYSPGIGPFFDRNALLYLTVDELSNLAMELREAGPLLSLLAERPDLSGMREVTRQLAMAADFGMLPSQGVDLMARLADVVEARGAGRPLSLDWRGLFGDGLVPDRTRWFVIDRKSVV